MNFMTNLSTVKFMTNLSLVNSTGCVQFEEAFISAISEGKTQIHEFSVTNITISVLFITCSIPFILFGRRLFKVVACTSAFFSLFYITLSFLQSTDNMSCEARLITSLVIGSTASLLVLSFINLALFMIGAAAFGALAHYIVLTIPESNQLPTLNNNSVSYYIIIVVSGLVGGVCVRCKQKLFLELATSLIGSFGVVYGTRGIVVHGDLNIPNAVLLSIGVFCAFAGTMFQRFMRLKKAKAQPAV